MIDKIEGLVNQLKSYADTRIALAKLEGARKVSDVISSIVATLMVALIMFLFITMVSIAGAIALGKWFGSMPLGFLAVGVLYLLACIVIWKAREKMLQVPIMNGMLKKLFPNELKDEREADAKQ